MDSQWHPHKRMLTLPTEDLCIRLNIYDLYCPALPRLRVFPSPAAGHSTSIRQALPTLSKRPDRPIDSTSLGASAGAGLAFTTAAGLDAREVAATMAQWITGYGPGRILKPAWAFEVATRFGEHFVNRERFEKVLGAHGFGHRTSSIHQSSHFTLFIGECTQRGTRRFLLYPYPGQWNINCGNFRAMDGGFTNNQPSLDSATLRVSPFGLRPSHDPTNV